MDAARAEARRGRGMQSRGIGEDHREDRGADRGEDERVAEERCEDGGAQGAPFLLPEFECYTGEKSDRAFY